MGSTRKGLGESGAAGWGSLQGAWTAQLTDRRPVRLDGVRLPPAGLMHGTAARHGTPVAAAAQINGLPVVQGQGNVLQHWTESSIGVQAPRVVASRGGFGWPVCGTASSWSPLSAACSTLMSGSISLTLSLSLSLSVLLAILPCSNTCSKKCIDPVVTNRVARRAMRGRPRPPCVATSGSRSAGHALLCLGAVDSSPSTPCLCCAGDKAAKRDLSAASFPQGSRPTLPR